MFKGMFDQAGSKLKIVVYITFVVEVIASIIFGIYLINDKELLMGLATIVLGPVVAWLCSLFPYTVAEIHQNTEALICYEMERRKSEKNKILNIHQNTEALLRYERERRYNEKK